MIATTLDIPAIRATLGVFVGLPLTAATLLGLPYALFFLVGGAAEHDLYILVVGTAGALGVFGVMGAWRRILKPHVAMTYRERVIVRIFLSCGIASSAILGAMTIHYGWVPGTAFFALLVLGGVILTLGTPFVL